MSDSLHRRCDLCHGERSAVTLLSPGPGRLGWNPGPPGRPHSARVAPTTGSTGGPTRQGLLVPGNPEPFPLSAALPCGATGGGAADQGAPGSRCGQDAAPSSSQAPAAGPAAPDGCWPDGDRSDGDCSAGTSREASVPGRSGSSQADADACSSATLSSISWCQEMGDSSPSSAGGANHSSAAFSSVSSVAGLAAPFTAGASTPAWLRRNHPARGAMPGQASSSSAGPSSAVMGS